MVMIDSLMTQPRRYRTVGARLALNAVQSDQDEIP